MRKIGILSNVMMDIVAEKLRKFFHVYIPDGFDTWISEIMSPSSEIYSSAIDALFVILDGTELIRQSDEEQEQKILFWKNAIKTLAVQTDKLLFVSTIDFRESNIKTYNEKRSYYSKNNDWYQFIQKLSDDYKNFYVLDLLQKITEIGRNYFYSPKMWYMGSMPYGKQGIQAISEVIIFAMEAAFESRKKILVLDMDNTLWGGIIGEHGLDGIILSNYNEGARFYDFQQKILEMKERGVILAINSKNNKSDAMEAFDHPFMVLKKDDFVNLKINWNDKASNIKEIESELNLTEGAFVFIDDNPMEREIVAGQCTEVYVPPFPSDTVELASFAEQLYQEKFQTLRLTDEDFQKTQMYQQENQRNDLKVKAANIEEYIKQLSIKANIHQIRETEWERVHQLCNKTNQFNLTTKRYSLQDIQTLSSSNDIDIFTVSTEDKFGDNGLISVIILKKEKTDVIIDSFLMSCRVMGRKLEYVIIGLLIRYYKDNFQNLIGEFIKTTKNIPVRNLYDELGFEIIESQENYRKYHYLLSKGYDLVDVYDKIIFNGEEISEH